MPSTGCFHYTPLLPPPSPLFLFPLFCLFFFLSALLSSSLSLCPVFLSALFQRTTLASHHFPQNNRDFSLRSSPQGATVQRGPRQELHALQVPSTGCFDYTSFCFAHTSLSCASFHLSASCLRIDVPVLFIPRVCRDIFCRHGGHVILDLPSCPRGVSIPRDLPLAVPIEIKLCK